MLFLKMPKFVEPVLEAPLGKALSSHYLLLAELIELRLFESLPDHRPILSRSTRQGQLPAPWTNTPRECRPQVGATLIAYF